MAAVLCRSIGQACQGVGSVLSHVICLPCRACGMGCEAMNDVCTSPFFPYLGLTFLLNLPPMVKTASVLSDFFGGIPWCERGSKWLIVNSVLCAIHIVASMYIVHKIRNDPPKEKRQQDVAPPIPATIVDTKEQPMIKASIMGGEKDDQVMMKKDVAGQQLVVEEGQYYAVASPASSVSSGSTIAVSPPLSVARIKDVLCEDPGMAIYLLVICFWFLWMMIGFSRFVQLGEECGDVHNAILVSLLCGYLYMGLVGMAFCCSMCLL